MRRERPIGAATTTSLKACLPKWPKSEIPALQDLDLAHWSAQFQEYERTGRFEGRSDNSNHADVAICDRSTVKDDPIFEI